MKYTIQGETLPVVICELQAGEKIITEGGGMAWMSPNMKMETTGFVQTHIQLPHTAGSVTSMRSSRVGSCFAIESLLK